MNIDTMNAQERLGILVKSGAYFDFIEKLTTAATEKGKVVKIHLIGQGVTLAKLHDLGPLAQQAQITICSSSFDQHFIKKKPPIPHTTTLTRPEQINDFVDWSDRCVVF